MHASQCMLVYCIRGAGSCCLMRSRPRFRQQAKIPYRPELRHLALVAVCAKRLIRHPVLALSLASSCAAGLTDSSTCICILHIRTWASSALSPGIDDQSASASHARECLRHRHVGGSCLLGESSCRHQCSYCPYLSAFMHAHTYRCTYSTDAHELNAHIYLDPLVRHISLQIRCAFF